MRISVTSRLYKLAGVLVSVLFVYLAVRKVDPSEFGRVFGTAQLGWLLVAIPIYLSAFPVRALRWRRILRNQKALSFAEVMVPVFVGHMVNNVLPARTGEVYRAHFLGRRARMSRSAAMGSIVVERAFDGLMLVGLMLLLFVLFPETHFLGGEALVVGLISLAVAVGILFYGSIHPVDRTPRAINKMLKILPQKLRGYTDRGLNSFLQGVRGPSTIGGYLEVVVYTVLVWALEMGAVSLVVISFGVALPLSGYLLVYALSALATTLPSGPGYVGPYQYAFVLGLGLFAVSQETALAVSVVAQLALIGSMSLIGLVLFWREQLWGGLQSNQEKPERKSENVG